METSDFSEEEKAELIRRLKDELTHGKKVDREAVIDAIRNARPAAVVKPGSIEPLPEPSKKSAKSRPLDRNCGRLISESAVGPENRVRKELTEQPGAAAFILGSKAPT